MKKVISEIKLLLLLTVFIVGCFYIYSKNIVDVGDTVINLVSKIEKIGKPPEVYVDVSDVAMQITKLVDKNEKVILPKKLYKSFFHIESIKLPKDQFVYEKNGNKWLSPFDFPGKDVRWVVLQNDKKQNAVYNLLETKNGNVFSKYYELKFQGINANLYKLKNKKDIPIIAYGDKLLWRYDRFIVKGINVYNLAYHKPKDIEKIFKNLSDAGVNTIRFWAFKDGGVDGFQTKAGFINKHRLKSLDFVMTMADEYNIHLIPVLVNNWDDFGGKKQYLKWSRLNSLKKDLFFTEAKPKKLFINYIDHIVPRQNSITQKYYRDDNFILAWEIMNEPRISSKNKSFLNSWVKEISSYIKEKDGNHLVYIGSEEELGGEDEQKAKKLCAIDTIDICSAHIYLYDNKKLVYKNLNQLSDFIVQQKEFATKVNKPIIIGEFGVSEKNRPYNKPPVETIKDIAQIIMNNNLDGYLIWNWDPIYYYDPLSFTTNKKRPYNPDNLKEILKVN